MNKTLTTDLVGQTVHLLPHCEQRSQFKPEYAAGNDTVFTIRATYIASLAKGITLQLVIASSVTGLFYTVDTEDIKIK